MRDQYIRSVSVSQSDPFLSKLEISVAQGLIFVYSVTSRSSFEFLEDIHKSIGRVKQDNLNPIIILVGNRCDLTWEQVSNLKADGAALARQYGCDSMETSAKTTQNIGRLFINIVRSLRQTRRTSQSKNLLNPCSRFKKRQKRSKNEENQKLIRHISSSKYSNITQPQILCKEHKISKILPSLCEFETRDMFFWTRLQVRKPEACPNILGQNFGSGLMECPNIMRSVIQGSLMTVQRFFLKTANIFHLFFKNYKFEKSARENQ